MGHSHGKHWNEELIKYEVLMVMKTLDVSRMPSRAEIQMVMGDTSLSNKIAKTGGFKYWADRLKLDMKCSDTNLGNEWEFIIKEKLEEKGYCVDKMTIKHPYDLLINKYVKVDVKVSNFVRRYNYYAFNLEKKNPTCDIFICVCLKDGLIEKLLVIPSKYLTGLCQLSVGENSKYDEFNNQFKYIDLYNDFYKSI